MALMLIRDAARQPVSLNSFRQQHSIRQKRWTLVPWTEYIVVSGKALASLKKIGSAPEGRRAACVPASWGGIICQSHILGNNSIAVHNTIHAEQQRSPVTCEHAFAYIVRLVTHESRSGYILVTDVVSRFSTLVA